MDVSTLAELAVTQATALARRGLDVALAREAIEGRAQAALDLVAQAAHHARAAPLDGRGAVLDVTA